MASPLDPTIYSPEEWQEVLQLAMAALRQNHNDQEALLNIQLANQALGAYDQAAAASPGERITSGAAGGAHGLAEAALDIPRSVIGAGKGAFNLAIDPEGTLDKLDQSIVGGMDKFGHAVTHPGETMNQIAESSPESVAHGVGTLGTLALPFAHTGAGSLALAGKGTNLGPTVGELATRGIKAPFNYLRDMARRPGLTNTGLELGNAAKAADLARGPTQDALLQEQLGSARANRQMAEVSAQHQPVDINRRLEMLEARIRQMPATQESIEL